MKLPKHGRLPALSISLASLLVPGFAQAQRDAVTSPEPSPPRVAAPESRPASTPRSPSASPPPTGSDGSAVPTTEEAAENTSAPKKPGRKRDHEADAITPNDAAQAGARGPHTSGSSTTSGDHATQGTSETSGGAVKGSDLIGRYLDARCLTAICFHLNKGEDGKIAEGDKNWLGIEPLVELPLGKASAVGQSSLNDHVNSHGFRVELAAGLRVWVFRDLISVAIYLSTPLSDDPVRLEGIAASFPSTSIRRPYPGVAVGLLYDLLWIGLDYDELRNGDGADTSAYTPLYPPNEVISSSAVITVAIQPVTAVRSLIGLLKERANPPNTQPQGR